MANRKIVCDKTEIILLDERNANRVYNLSYHQIIRIDISNCNESSWFRKIPGEKIEIYSLKRSEPFVFYKTKNRPFFEEYKRELAEFAKSNRLTIKDATRSEQSENENNSEAI